jgi:Tol biopolymer transport system component
MATRTLAGPAARRRFLPALALAVLLAVPGLALAAPRKLSGPLAVGGHVEPLARSGPAGPLRPGYQLTPNGAAVVYLADQDTADVVELYQAPSGGGAPLKLSAPLAPGGDVVEFAVVPGGERVVYLADQREDERYELFSVPLGGGQPVVLSGLLVAGGDVTSFAVSPDGSAVVFRADRNDDEAFDLFTVPAAGGLDRRLNERAGPLADVQPDFAVTPDNQRVLFRANPLNAETFDLFSAPLTGGPAVSLGRGAFGGPGGASVLDFVASPDGGRVAIRAGDPASGDARLYLAPAAGSDAFFVALTPLGPGSSVEAPPRAELAPDERPPAAGPPYAFTPDGGTVVFIADAVDTVYQLFAVPAPPSAGPPAPFFLLSHTVTGPRDVLDFQLSPVGGRVVFRADIVDDAFELISVRVSDGAGTVFLFPAARPSADVGAYAIAPDGARVVYTGDFGLDGRDELRSTPIDSSTGTVVLNGTLAPGGGVRAFAVAAGGQRVIFSADQDVAGVVELYSVLTAGGEPARLSPTLPTGGDVADFVVGPGLPAGPVVFRADSATDEVFNLLSVPAQGGPVVALTDVASVSGDVLSFALTPAGDRAVYLADQETDEVFELYVSPLRGGGPRRLSGAMAPGGDVAAFAISPAGGQVVYLADQEADGVTELYSAPLDGGPPLKLSGAMAPGGDVAAFAISPAGEQVVYLADQEADGRLDLYSAPLAGGTTPVRLSSMAVGRAFHEFAITADGRRVVYRAEQNLPGAPELYSAALAGGPPLTLSAPLPQGGAVAAFTLSPDGARAVYAGQQAAAGVTEIYSVPAAGGEPTRLNPPLPPGGDVAVGTACVGRLGQWDPRAPGATAPFLVSPDGRRVLYCADGDADEVLELYSAPIAEGSAAVKLSAPPGAGNGVREFQVAPDSARAAFVVRATEDGAPVERLFSAPLTGGRPPTPLNPDRQPTTVGRFAFSPDGATVAFAGVWGPAGAGLYAVPAAGGEVSLRAGGAVGPFLISRDGQRVVYRAGPRLLATVLAGNATPAVMADPAAVGGAVRDDFRLSPLGDVVFRADAEAEGVVELYLARFGGPPGIYLPVVGSPPESSRFPWP